MNSKENSKIKIWFSDEDLQELQDGNVFNWIWTDQFGNDIDVELLLGEEEE